MHEGGKLGNSPSDVVSIVGTTKAPIAAFQVISYAERSTLCRRILSMHSIVSIGDEETVQSNMCENSSDPAAYCDVSDKDTAPQLVDEMEVLADIRHIV